MLFINQLTSGRVYDDRFGPQPTHHPAVNFPEGTGSTVQAQARIAKKLIDYLCRYNENRGSDRKKLVEPLFCFLFTTETERVVARLVDVSEVGIGITSALPINLNSSVTLEFDDFEIKGKICWSTRTSSGEHHAGISTSDYNLKKLIDLIQEKRADRKDDFRSQSERSLVINMEDQAELINISSSGIAFSSEAKLIKGDEFLIESATNGIRLRGVIAWSQQRDFFNYVYGANCEGALQLLGSEEEQIDRQPA